MYCTRLHAWWSTQSRLANLLSSLIARQGVGLQTLWRIRLKDLSIGEMVGAWCFGCCQTHRYLLDSFCSGIQFYLRLSPYLCFISFLYLDLYIIGDDALISSGSYMQTKHLCVMIHIWTKGEVGAPWNWFKPSGKIFLLTVPRRWFFCGSFMLFLSCFCYTFARFCLSMSCGHLLGKRWPQAGTLIFSYIRRLGSFFWVQNFEFQFFGGFQKKKIFFGVWRFCGYLFWVITKLI